jgi:hypothetical protein
LTVSELRFKADVVAIDSLVKFKNSVILHI